ncbi:cytochrome P450 [Streptomyces sp. NBC_00631]|uniref:cytochrome P450 n=1 Tax=Streptomyces sp. NBC_00631 TaxID=2975793 RepID=UPI0030E2DC89
MDHRTTRRTRARCAVPGPGGHRAGTLAGFTRDPLAYLAALRQTYGPVCRLPVPGKRIVLVADPAGVHAALTDRTGAFVKGRPEDGSRSAYDTLPLRLLGDGMLTSSGATHRDQLRRIAPGLGPHRMPALEGIFVEEAEALARRWAAEPGVRDVQQDLARLALAVICRTLFGWTMREEEELLLTRALAAGTRWSIRPFVPGARVLDHLPVPRTVGWRRVRRDVRGVFDELSARPAGCPGGTVLFDSIRAGRHCPTRGSRAELVVDETLTLLVAGHETTANGLFWCLELLARHPEAQARVQAEIRAAARGGHPVGLRDLPELPYTGAVFREALRLYPPVWLTSRTLTRAAVLAGCRLSEGTVVLVSPWVTHRDPGVWSSPAAFLPERWLDRTGRLTDRAAYPADGTRHRRYLPFGAGPRRCAGQVFAETESVIVLAALLRDQVLEPVAGHRATPWPAYTLRPCPQARLRVRAVPGHRRRPARLAPEGRS